jgi:hypothetical protein
MVRGRKENRKSAQEKFRNACKGAGLSRAEMRAFSHYCHDHNVLYDYMPYGELKRLASTWKRSKADNPYA